MQNIANVDQARSWDGSDGDHWTENVENYEAASDPHYQRLRQVAAVAPGERVLDIGCGCGRSTIDAAAAATGGSAHGADLSSRMLAFARERAKTEGITNVKFEQADAQVHPFEAASFDIAMSRTGCMFFADPVAAFNNINRALKPGGRLALLTWQGAGENEWLREIQTALAAGRQMPAPPPPGGPGPLSMSDPAVVRDILGRAGFEDIEMESVRRPFKIGNDADDAFRFMSGSGIAHGMLNEADDATRQRAFDNLAATFKLHDTGNGVIYDSGSWVITARKP